MFNSVVLSPGRLVFKTGRAAVVRVDGLFVIFDTAGELIYADNRSINWTKRAVLLASIGLSSNHQTMRLRLIATAVNRCCRCIFAIPM